MTAVGVAWPLLMWLTPATGRPWISGTSDNSIWSLILGYNGLGRLFGQDGGPGGGMGGAMFGGEPGALRLLNEALGGQAGWLLGVALVGGAAVLALTRLDRRDARTGWLIAVGGTFLTTAVAFSRAEGIFHPYYVAQLAPFTAALVGAAVATMRAGRGRRARRDRRREWRPSWRSPTATRRGSLRSESGAAALLASDVVEAKVRTCVVAAAIAALLALPASWSLQTLGHAASGTFPAGGPATMVAGGGPARRPRPGGPGAGGFGPGAAGGMFGGDTSTLGSAIEFAQANGGGTVAVSSQSGAAGSLITSGADVAAIGGFSGRESQVSIDWLADAVEQGRIRYVLTEGADGLPNDSRVGSSQVMAAVEAVGTPVSAVEGLYDLQGLAGELRAA